MARVAVAPGPWAKGFDGVRENVRDAYRVLDLVEALTATYRSDAHCVTYVVPGAARQSRVTKAGLPFFPHALEVDVFFCDVDNPGHGEWTAPAFGEAHAQSETLHVLATAGVMLPAMRLQASKSHAGIAYAVARTALMRASQSTCPLASSSFSNSSAVATTAVDPPASLSRR